MCFGWFKKKKKKVEEPKAEEKVEEVKAEPAPVAKAPAETVKAEEAPKAVAKEAAPKAKKAAPKAKKVEKVEEAEEDKKDNKTKVYHVSKRASDGKWVVKFANGKKVVKTFPNRRQAVDYADVLAKNQEGIVLTHASKGAKQGKINQKRKKLED